VPTSIMLACNNPDNGEFTGECDFIEFDSGSGDIEIRMQGRSVTVNFERKGHRDGGPATGDCTLRVGRITIPALGYESWVGNWCWDEARVRHVFALKVLNYLIRRGWHCEEGPSEFFDAINSGRQLTPNEWKAATK
jgi:hypothetical protein